MKTWFITGASRGLGRVWAEAALQRGDRVVATARDLSTLDDLVGSYGEDVLALELDVTDKTGGEAAIRKAATTSAGSTSWSTTPATACWAPSRR